jgi:hypothetical protein
MESPQHFCEGALVANLTTPNNQIVWYKQGGTTPLLPTEKLEAGFYEATQKAGTCESNPVTVEVILDKYPEPTAMSDQCYKSGMKLSDLTIIGANIKWYATASGGTPLPLTHTVNAGDKYWAAQSLGNCESDRIEVIVAANCYTPHGTVFPFVHTGDATFDDQFVTTAKLYVLPSATAIDKIGAVRKQIPVQAVRVTYYDCPYDIIQILKAPKHPGVMGNTNNPGKPIRWADIGVTDPGTVDATEAGTGCPEVPIGKYIFEGIAEGKYVLEIARQGFMPRYGVIEVEGSDYLGHREILGGELTNDLGINEKDISVFFPNTGRIYGLPLYDWKFDVNGDRRINNADVQIIRVNLGAGRFIYQEAKDWLNP